jgi:glucose/arabinose dehydrogenase
MQSETFATGLSGAFGVNFYPVGRDPQWVYVGNTASVVRFPYRNGDMKARGAAETIIEKLPAGGHSTRDLVFSNDGQSMYVAVGSASNIDDPDTHASEFHRANILEYKPDGTFVSVYASGIRNPVGLAIHPTTGELWTSINERDNLGDNLVPDYITHVQKGGFYGWPYFYIGGNPDARLMGAHAELKGKVIVPDVLIQAHSASVGMAFYTGSMFPAEYRNDAFAAEHGSWNRSIKAGHEVVRVPLDNGKSNGVYQDFLTGFLNADGNPWGRPVGIATAPDGSMLVTDDGANVIWRVSYRGNGK